MQIIRPSYLLRAKIGSGFIPTKIIERARKIFEFNTVDFSPMALEHLDALEDVIAQTRAQSLNAADAARQMAEIVMQLKANAAVFNYPLIGRLAAIMLGFLESLKAMDADALEIVSAHHKTLKVIIQKRMRGDGGANGRALEAELASACARYQKARQQT